jgi:hypothetical protein
MQDKSILGVTLGRSVTGTIAGIGAVVLAILGLARIHPFLMASLATIVIGVSLMFKAIAIAAEYPKLLSQTDASTAELGGGMSAEFIAGGAGIVLGILALIGIDFASLTAIAVIIFGGGLIMGSSIVNRLNSLRASVSGVDSTTHKVAGELVSGAMSVQVLIGVSAAVLGILSLIGFKLPILTLVALLAIGASSLLTGAAVTGKMVSTTHH